MAKKQPSREELQFQARERQRKREAMGASQQGKPKATAPKPAPSLLDSLVDGFKDITGIKTVEAGLKGQVQKPLKKKK